MVNQIQKLADAKGRVWNEIEGLRDELVAGKFTPDLDEKFDRQNKEYDRLDKEIKRLEEVEAIDVQNASKIGEVVNGKEISKKDAEAKYGEVFNKWMSKGLAGLSDAEQNIMGNRFQNAAQQTISTTGGGYTIPEAFSGKVSETLAYYGPFSPVEGVGPGMKIFTSGGNPLPWPTITDVANTGQNLAINVDATTASAALAFGVKNLGAEVITSDLIQVPKQLLQDEGVNFESLLATLLGKRMGRRFNSKVTNDQGGTSEFSMGLHFGATQGGVTAADDAITANEIINLLHSVDIEYRNSPGAGFMINDAIAAYIRKLTVTASADYYLWEPSFTEGNPDKMLGKKVWINNDLPSAITVDKRTIFFGDFDQLAIRVVKGMELIRLDERFAEKYQVGWMGTLRADCNVLQTGAIKFLRQLNT
jgi:HK97 family phage major capsid protein